MLAARGVHTPAASDGIEAALCEALGIARQTDYPLAPITLAADGGTPGDAYWLRADPVHVALMRDHLVLAGNAGLQLTASEAEALAASLRSHFGAALDLVVAHPTRWYLRLSAAPHLVTTALSVATGRDVRQVAPTGEDARAWRRVLNEAQMLLFDHPVNRAREALGAPSVNSLWLWGGGTLPARQATARRLFANDSHAVALGRFVDAEVAAVPERFVGGATEADDIVVLDALDAGGQAGDASGWGTALLALDRDWFVPLFNALRRLEVTRVRLVDPVNGRALGLQARDAWKFWRRPQG